MGPGRRCRPPGRVGSPHGPTRGRARPLVRVRRRTARARPARTQGVGRCQAGHLPVGLKGGGPQSRPGSCEDRARPDGVRGRPPERPSVTAAAAAPARRVRSPPARATERPGHVQSAAGPATRRSPRTTPPKDDGQPPPLRHPACETKGPPGRRRRLDTRRKTEALCRSCLGQTCRRRRSRSPSSRWTGVGRPARRRSSWSPALSCSWVHSMSGTARPPRELIPGGSSRWTRKACGSAPAGAPCDVLIKARRRWFPPGVPAARRPRA